MKIHIVKKGDTLYMIAQKYNVSLEEVLKLNPNIANPDMIDVGMKVKIPTSMASNMEIMHQHAVKQGDTLWKLSKAWGVPLSDMIKANPQLKNPNALLTGELVNIPKSGTPSGMPPEMHTTQHPFGGSSHSSHTPLHPMSMLQGVQGLMGKIPTAPLIGKKPTGEKPFTAPIADTAPMPAPVPMPLPAAVPAPLPAPITMPIVQQPAQKKAYPMHIEYEQHIDLFKQYGMPATEVMSMYDMPQVQGAVSPAAQMPGYGHGYGYPATYPSVYPGTTGGYGYPQPMSAGMVSPASAAAPDWCPPESVMGAATLPWGAPSKVHFGSWGQQMTGPYQTQDDCGPELVSPAGMHPYGGGYGYDHQMVSPFSADPYCEQQSYGHGADLGSPAIGGFGGGGGGSYGYEPAMVSPSGVGGFGGGGGSYGFGHQMVSPAGVGGFGDGGGGGYGFGHQMVSPAGVGGFGDGGGGSYGFGHHMVSPAGVGGFGDGSGGDYGCSPAMGSPSGVGGVHGGGGSYGFGPQTVSPAGVGGLGGGGGSYGFGHQMVSPAGVSPFGGGHGYGGYPSAVSPAAAGGMEAPFQSYNYVGYGQVSPLQTAGVVKKPCDCGCKDRVENADVRVDKVEQPKSSKPVKSRKTAAKASIRTARQTENKRRNSLPWINR
ncbi:LysM peptidoglycan-binding domain-containing protein [Paenibacillus sp. sptzw28]|uniref:LysM peptidoglycan-binding domain-containing protein n=1 Tax=Paenibacillus sp. sptzw28 TaxID=715179 RepID=UPI001C6F301D|nr:LysM peptidoglycan-binding domain-containing protein [Paenibacillus sp. sptzw28]QYR23399.1 LysM peptidoglycan-binding domain-containing protein [Paenibacillus sp. sptzw28]